MIDPDNPPQDRSLTLSRLAAIDLVFGADAATAATLAAKLVVPDGWHTVCVVDYAVIWPTTKPMNVDIWVHPNDHAHDYIRLRHDSFDGTWSAVDKDWDHLCWRRDALREAVTIPHVRDHRTPQAALDAHLEQRATSTQPVVDEGFPCLPVEPAPRRRFGFRR